MRAGTVTIHAKRAATTIGGIFPAGATTGAAEGRDLAVPATAADVKGRAGPAGAVIEVHMDLAGVRAPRGADDGTTKALLPLLNIGAQVVVFVAKVAIVPDSVTTVPDSVGTAITDRAI